ncbi:MAG: KAP family NTPase [Bacteroidales bacterium]|nr:KAP family NTPase [Lachnoclostridium sp.]MCM1383671.1 KAP family NTPase [Lachnoclostridium sp.]MCM1466380.1 KAP family NTPase [Bacteroidales bacterium]
MSNKIDLLDRANFIENVIAIVNQLSDNKTGCCFAIEGGWGIGKTFVIEDVEEKLKIIQSEETKTDKYFVFHYNCWQHDYYEEPSVAIISAMSASLKEDDTIVTENIDNTIKTGYEIVAEKLKEIAGTFIKNKIGINLISIADEIQEKKEESEKSAFEFDKMFNFSQTIEKVRRKLQEIAQQRTIILVVDELDRCIPQYAIKVLERLHHIFYGLENVVVIMTIDRKQLEHSVEEMFGSKNDDNSMDIEKYLKKFIDFSMVLDNGTVNESFQDKYQFYFKRFIVNNTNDLSKGLQLFQVLLSEVDIRKQEKIIEKANLIHSLICNTQVDVSMLFFEIMYEILKSWGIDDLGYVVSINDISNPSLEKIFGITKLKAIKSLNTQAFNTENIEDINSYKHIKVVKSDLFGKVFWYFREIFYDKDSIYKDRYHHMDAIKNEIEIAKKYCEFCKIIK